MVIRLVVPLKFGRIGQTPHYVRHAIRPVCPARAGQLSYEVSQLRGRGPTRQAGSIGSFDTGLVAGTEQSQLVRQPNDTGCPGLLDAIAVHEQQALRKTCLSYQHFGAIGSA